MENKQKKSSDAQIKAIAKYRDSHYKRLVADIKPTDFEFIDDYAKEQNISKASLIVKSIRYIADNKIKLD